MACETGGRRSSVPRGGFRSMFGYSEFQEEGVGPSFVCHGGLRTVTRVGGELVGELQETAEASLHVRRRGVREVVPADGASEHEVTREDPSPGPETGAARRVPRRLQPLQAESRQLEDVASRD